MKLWNYKFNDLPANGLPTRAWSRQPSHQLDKVSEGRRREHLLNNPGLYFTYNCHPQYIWGYFAEKWNKSHWKLQRIYRLTVCNRRAYALSRRCRVSRSRPRVFRETIGVFDWAIGHELIFRSSHFLIRLVPVTKQLHDRGYFVLTGQKGPVTCRLHRGRHCILVTWYTINGKYRCFSRGYIPVLTLSHVFQFFMMLPWRVPWWKQNLCSNRSKSLDCFPVRT